jgi:hypothetical protein
MSGNVWGIARTAGSLAAALALAACPGGGSKQQTIEVSAEFECHERRAEYSVQGGMLSMGEGLQEPEAGVMVSCAGDQGPRLEKWQLLDKGGKRKSDVRKLSSGDFDVFWAKIESTGWRNLSECENPGAPQDDPVYTITISNDQAEYTTTCQGRDLPFPFDRIRNELDLAAAGYSN